MATEIDTIDRLKQVADKDQEELIGQASHLAWVNSLGDYLRRVHEVSEAQFLDEVFQRELWESDTLSATGMGQVNVSEIISNPEVARKLWEIKGTSLPDDPAERARAIAAEWNELEAMIVPLVTRTPRLKMYRVMAALRPADFTTVAHLHKIRRLAKAMGVNKGVDHPTQLHRRVLNRLKEALGDAGPALAKPHLERMTLPWVLYAKHVQEQGEEATEVPGEIAGAERLKPLPADRRRRGMLSIAGGLTTVRAMIEFASEGCKREDFREHVRSVSPQLAASSINTTMNALIAEWGVLRAVGDNLSLTPRGEALLESGEQEEVSDWLLTRVLGFDNVLHVLRNGAKTNKQLMEFLQQVNPGWTSNFLPSSMINWVRSLGLAEFDSDKALQLTERGRAWAERIHWTPGMLPADPGATPDVTSPVSAIEKSTGKVSTFARPALSVVIASFSKEFKFSDQLVGRLDAGLWSHERRHFAILTGLSGSGKTQLALSYARGLWANEAIPEKGVCIVPVQPGWHDPSSLLGYVNPLNADTYVRTGFLNFLLDASNDPERPYTVILDEMNLSHPEQYLAPLLSTMETGAGIELHAQGDSVDGVPAKIPYPKNLVIVGTVNMDETTHGLSDKVLDRASVIEFWDIDVDSYPGWSSTGLNQDQAKVLRKTLVALMDALKPVRLHFGWRTIDNVVGYVSAALAGKVIGFSEALDGAVYSKILPKLRGEDTPRLQKAFEALQEVLKDAGLSQSEAKAKQLLDDMKHTGSARFWR